MGFRCFRRVLVILVCFSFLVNNFNNLVLINGIDINNETNDLLETKSTREIEFDFKLNNYVMYCNDILLFDNLLYFVGGRARIADISKASKPIFHYYNNSRDFYPKAITRVQDTILINFFDNYAEEAIAKINPHKNITKLTIIPSLNFNINKMIGTDDRLFILNHTYSDIQSYSVFSIYNASDLDNLSLIRKQFINTDFKDFYLFENFVYFIKNEDRLVIYQMNSSSELSFIKEYTFNYNINSLYFTNDSLFICNENGLALYNHSSPLALTKQCEYNITDAESVSVSENIAFVVNEKKIYKFDISNVNNIKMIKKHTVSNRIYSGLKKINEEEGKLYIMQEYTSSSGEYYEDFLLIYESKSIRRIYPIVLPLSFQMQIFLFYGSIFIMPIICIFAIIIVIIKRLERKDKTSKIKLEIEQEK